MKTFNIELWDALRAKQEDRFMQASIFFGLVPEDTPAPYCVMHALDSGNDEEAKTLCDDSVGKARIQFNVYGINGMSIDESLAELNRLIKSLKILKSYRIIKGIRERTKNANKFSSEVGQGFTEFKFQYEGL